MSQQGAKRNAKRQLGGGKEADLPDKIVQPPKKHKLPSKSRKRAAKDIKGSDSALKAEPPKICDSTGFYKHTGGDVSNR